MKIEDYDKTTTTDEIISKADNIFMMLYTAYMLKDMTRVDHKVSDKIMDKYQALVDQDRSNRVIHMFDELNVKTSSVENIEIKDNKIVVTIKLISRYLNYYIDQDTKEFIRGNKNDREEHTNILTLEKEIDSTELKSVSKCPGCGHSMDTAYTGVCNYCGAIFNTEKYDYVLTNIETI